MTTTIFNPKLFKTYNKYTKDHANVKKAKDVFEETTYHRYLGNGSSIINEVLVTNISLVKSKKELRVMLEENFEAISLALEAMARTSTSDQWRNKRISLGVVYKAAGLSKYASQITSMKNPVPVSERSHNTKKSKRMQKVTDSTLDKIYKNRREAEDYESIHLMTIFHTFGTRPSEVEDLKIEHYDEETITVRIAGSKKTMIGKHVPKRSRGLDRTLTVTYSKEILDAIEQTRHLDLRKIENARERVVRASRKLFPDSQRHFCFYSLRYMFGANLKRQLYHTKEGRIIAAAILGHKNTSSISSYGHYRSGSAGAVIPKVDPEVVKKVRDNIASKFGKDRGEHFDIKKAITEREYLKKPGNDLSP